MHVCVCVSEFEILELKWNRFIFVLTKKNRERIKKNIIIIASLMVLKLDDKTFFFTFVHCHFDIEKNLYGLPPFPFELSCKQYGFFYAEQRQIVQKVKKETENKLKFPNSNSHFLSKYIRKKIQSVFLFYFFFQYSVLTRIYSNHSN